MSEPIVHVVARLTAAPGMGEQLRRVLLALVPPTRAEPGCLRYDLLQSESDPEAFVFLEQWASAGDLDAHLKTPHFQQAAQALEGKVTAPPDIRRYRAASSPGPERGSST